MAKGILAAILVVVGFSFGLAGIANASSRTSVTEQADGDFSVNGFWIVYNTYSSESACHYVGQDLRNDGLAMAYACRPYPPDPRWWTLRIFVD